VVLVAPDNAYETLMAFIEPVRKKIEENFADSQVVIHPAHLCINNSNVFIKLRKKITAFFLERPLVFINTKAAFSS
jgi:hypothetical protein